MAPQSHRECERNKATTDSSVLCWFPETATHTYKKGTCIHMAIETAVTTHTHAPKYSQTALSLGTPPSPAQTRVLATAAAVLGCVCMMQKRKERRQNRHSGEIHERRQRPPRTGHLRDRGGGADAGSGEERRTE